MVLPFQNPLGLNAQKKGCTNLWEIWPRWGFFTKIIQELLMEQTTELTDENIGAHENYKDWVEVLASYPVPKGRQPSAQGATLCHCTITVLALEGRQPISI